jgi:hypothetical protein
MQVVGLEDDVEITAESGTNLRDQCLEFLR